MTQRGEQRRVEQQQPTSRRTSRAARLRRGAARSRSTQLP